MASEGDKILFALSAWGSCSWDRYRRAVDTLYSPQLRDDDEHTIAHLRGLVIRQLQATAHCDLIDRDGNLAVLCCPPLLARLPRSGLPTAVLCGTRSMQTVDEVRVAAQAEGARVVADGGSSEWWAPPTVIRLHADDEEILQAVAGRLGIRLPSGFPAWDIANASASVGDYLGGLVWASQLEPGWPAHRFNSEKARWEPGGRDESEFILNKYIHPDTKQNQFWLWNGDQFARVDPDWARYAVLARAGRSVLEYDPDTRELLHPSGAPLPALLARALSLCSGVAPGHLAREDKDGVVRAFRRYRDVTGDVARKVSEKLEQGVGG